MFAAFGVASPFLPALLHERGLGPSEIGAGFRCELSRWRDSRYMDPGWIGRGGANGSERRLQGAAIHRRGDPVGRSLVSDVSPQLPRSGTHPPPPRPPGPPPTTLPFDPTLSPT